MAHVDLALGFVGFAVGIGATLHAPTIAGMIADRLGEPARLSDAGGDGLRGTSAGPLRHAGNPAAGLTDAAFAIIMRNK